MPFVKFVVLLVIILKFSDLNLAQAPNLGSLANFVLFTSAGAVGNTATSHITGDIGTNVGAITGFETPTIHIGDKHEADPTTLQASLDLTALYNELDTTTPTSTDHAAVLGGGETLYAGVYSNGAAGSLAGNLILDAQGVSGAVFIFKFGGAFTTAASSSVTLINGALPNNVFWIAEGAIAMAALTAMKGTLIANNAAISMGAGGTLVGRMLSTAGAVTIYASTVSTVAFPFLNPGEIPDLGAAASFVLFTSAGAVGNVSTSNITGDIGTQVGAITGFGPPTVVNGNQEIANAKTLQALIDLKAAYLVLVNTPPTSTDHAPAFGGGETLLPGVYSIAAAGSVAGDLTLDGGGNPNAVFIFKFGGAFTTGAITSVHLINGASACNVFWAVDGAIGMAAATDMKGTLIANSGAVSMDDGGTLEGRLLSTGGAAAIYANTLFIPSCSFALAFTSQLFKGNCDGHQVVLKWTTLSETNNDYFSVERSFEGTNWYVVGTIDGKGNSNSLNSYTIIDLKPTQKSSIYRLKQTDFNGNHHYGNEVSIKNCGAVPSNQLVIYPNPSNGRINLLFSDFINQPYSIEIFNTNGQKVYSGAGSQTKIDLSNQIPGIYFMQVQQNLKIINARFIIK